MTTEPAILIADQSEADHSAYAEALNGYVLHFVTNEPDFAQLLQEQPNFIKLVIVAWEPSGITVVNRLKRLNRDLPVIMVSRDAHPQRLKQISQLGVADLIRKPLDLDRLRCAAVRLMAGPTLSPLVEATIKKLQQRFVGRSAAWLTTLERTARL